MNILSVAVNEIAAHPLGDSGVTIRRLWRSGPGATASRAAVLDFQPGAQVPHLDVHEPGPEEVFVVEGEFIGLDGAEGRHGPGTFLHCEAGTSHRPRSPTGGRLFVFYPQG